MTAHTLQSIKDTLVAIVAKTIGKAPSDIRTDIALDDQGVDSLAFAELMFDIEDNFGSVIQDNAEEMKTLKTIDQLAARIFEKLEG